nr:hypothetical protein [Tanacetum cinerariifolium]
MATIVENVIAAGFETRPLMLEKGILEDLDGQDKLRYDSDIKTINILLLGFPVDIYTLINHCRTAKEIWDGIKQLMEGTKMTKQESDNLKEIDDCDNLQLQATINFNADQVDAYDSDCDDEATENVISMENLSPVGSLNDDTIEPHQVDAYDSDCDDEATENVISMENLSPVGSLNDDTIEPRYDFDILFEVIPKVIEKNDLTKLATSHLNTKKIIEKCTKVLAPGRVSFTNAGGSNPRSNTKKDRIPQPSSKSMKNKLEAHYRKFKSSANKNNHVSDCNTNVKNIALSKNSNTIYLSYNECLCSANYDACVVQYLKKMQKCKVDKSAKQKVKSECKPT